MKVFKRFAYETAVVAVGLAACCWFKMTGQQERAAETWRDVESEICGEQP
jgi:hypothetical protein